jgi:replicative DNA helicase
VGNKIQEIEKEVLGEMIMCGNLDMINDAVEIAKEDYFTNEEYKNILKAIRFCIADGKIPDSILVYEYGKKFNLKFSPVVLSSISQHIASTTNLVHHCKIIAERWYQRKMQAELSVAIKKLDEPLDIEDVERLKNDLIINISQVDIFGSIETLDYVPHLKRIEDNLEKIHSTIDGYSTGLTDLDNYLGGLIVPRFVVIGALKKGGKTRFATHLRKHLYKQNVITPFISLEVPGYEFTKLMYSCFAEIDDVKLRSGSLIKNEEKQRFYKTKRELDLTKLPTECVAGLDLPKVLKRIKYFAKRYPGCVIFIDYMQRIDHNEDRQAQQLEKYARELADATRTYNVTIIMLSQLRNFAENAAPTTGDLKGSGGIAEAADVILLLDNLYRRTRDEANRDLMDIYIEQRYGDSGKITIRTELSKSAFWDKLPDNMDLPPEFKGRPILTSYKDDYDN